MQTIEELKSEEVLNRKIRQKRRIRGVLIVVNALLVSYAGYLTVSSIVNAVSNSKDKEQGDIITLLDKSVDESNKLYSKYINEQTNIVDVATYGRYLVTSSSRVTHNTFMRNQNATLVKVVEENIIFGDPKLSYTLDNSLNSQIDLFSLDKGDYLIYNNYDLSRPNEKNVYHYTGSELYQETLYSFPYEDGSRTKITLKGKGTSPALVISVTDVKAAPESYYDFVVLDEQHLVDSKGTTSWVYDLQSKYKVKIVNSLVDAYKVKAAHAIEITSGSELLSSNFISYPYGNKSNVIINGVLEGLDTNNAIRELGGYLFNAGYGVSSDGTDIMNSVSQSSISIKNNISSSHLGKMTLSVGNQIESSEVERYVKDFFKL